MPANIGGNTAPEVYGATLFFELLQFPEQITTDPDPIQSLNLWTREFYPHITIINHDEMPPVWKPSDEFPAIHCQQPKM
jgi:hypothetical protein